MTPQSMIKKIFWIGLFSWIFSGTAKAQCVHEAGAGRSFTQFHVPTQGDLLLFGLTVLLLWGFSTWMMHRFFPNTQLPSGTMAAGMQSEEFSGLQTQTSEALKQVEAEYEEMILNRLDQVENSNTSHQEAQEFRSQRAVSV